jgi:hypothetical protein
LLAGLGTSIAGAIKGNKADAEADKAAEAARKEYQTKQQFLDETFNKQYYQNITDRTEVQNLMRLMEENQEKQTERDEALAAITGATPEAQLAAQEQRNKSYAETLADIASNASSMKDTMLQNYTAQKLGLTNPEYSLLMDKSQRIQNKADRLSTAGSNLMMSGASMLGGSGIEPGGVSAAVNAKGMVNNAFGGVFGVK